ncbi:LysR family transcriptional regulator [uncultured Enterovirga sp.]|uniref:LysR family transcriptional regulator n=1 Tax=uncultured Enterovirga sp. TaxID=2026352 RepID=UPI0035C96FD8
MDEVRLRSMLFLAEELHFGRAAERLGIAQPHLSRRIQELEREIGTPLFLRTHRRVELTPAGAFFAGRARDVLGALKAAVQQARDIGVGTAGVLRVGFIHSSTYGILPALLAGFRSLRPGISVQLREMTILAQVGALRAGEIDVGILRLLPDVQDLSSEVVLREPFLLALPQGHPLASRRGITLRQLAGEPLIMFPRETSPLFHARITAAFARIGAVPEVVQEATQIHTVLGLVGAGLGIAFVPASAARLPRSGVTLLTLPDGPKEVTVAIAWSPDHPPASLSAFLEAARSGSQTEP